MTALAFRHGEVLPNAALGAGAATRASHPRTGVLERLCGCRDAGRSEPSPFRLQDHLARLLGSARFYGMTPSRPVAHLGALAGEVRGCSGEGGIGRCVSARRRPLGSASRGEGLR